MADGAKKIRVDAWGEGLAEDVRWTIYSYTRPRGQDEDERTYLRSYEEASRWLSDSGYAVPSRAAWYRFLGRMRCAERIRIVEQIASSARTAGATAKVAVDDGCAAETFKGLAVDAALEGDAERSAVYARASALFAERASKAAELGLKERAQATKEDQLRLAREKFEAAERREAAAKGVIGDTKLTPEERDAKLKEIFGIG